MGFSTSIFLEEPGESLICSICQDVLEEPRSLQCGHSFCLGCLDAQKEAAAARDQRLHIDNPQPPPCPTCRGPGDGGNGSINYAVRGIISSLKISCRHNFENDRPDVARAAGNNGDDGDEHGRRVRRRINENTGTCFWTGRLDEWQNHAKNQCSLEIVQCNVAGCNFRCRRSEMAEHRRSDACIDARIDTQVTAAVAAVEKTLATIRADYQGGDASLEARVVKIETDIAAFRTDHQWDDASIDAMVDTKISAAVAVMEKKLATLQADEKYLKASQKTIVDTANGAFRRSGQRINTVLACQRFLREEEEELHKEMESRHAKQKFDLLKSHETLEKEHDKLKRNYEELETKYEELGQDYEAFKKRFLGRMEKDEASQEKSKELEGKHEELGKKLMALEKKFVERMEKAQEKSNVIAKELVHFESNKGGRHVLSFCREWMVRKPDPLFNFVVYREPMTYEVAAKGSRNELINQRKAKDLTLLLVGIPGPDRTPWEGGLYPVLFKWDPSKMNDDPPTCRFPPGFQHPNVDPNSGTIRLSTLTKGFGWSPDITIPEIMFDIQQLLAHPNFNASASVHAHSKEEYDGIARNLAKTYHPGLFSEEVTKAFASSVTKNSGTTVHLHVGIDHIPNVLVEDSSQALRNFTPPEPTFHGSNYRMPSCSCSCCAWGTATGSWDARLEMRFLWGVGR